MYMSFTLTRNVPRRPSTCARSRTHVFLLRFMFTFMFTLLCLHCVFFGVGKEPAAGALPPNPAGAGRGEEEGRRAQSPRAFSKQHARACEFLFCGRSPFGKGRKARGGRGAGAEARAHQRGVLAVREAVLAEAAPVGGGGAVRETLVHAGVDGAHLAYAAPRLRPAGWAVYAEPVRS